MSAGRRTVDGVTTDGILVAQVSDLHVGIHGDDPPAEAAHRRRLAAALDRIGALDPTPALLIASGDLTHDGGAEEVDALGALLAASTVPVLAVPGNHDDRDALVAGGVAVPSATGALDAVVDLGPLRVVALDTLHAGHPSGRLDDAQLAWLDDRLAEDGRPVLLVLHHPPLAIGHAPMDTMALEAPEALGAVLDRHRHVVRIACGHVHRTVVAEWRGIGVVTAPSLDVQLAPAFAGQERVEVTGEPPGYVVHRWHGRDGLSSHVFALT